MKGPALDLTDAPSSEEQGHLVRAGTALQPPRGEASVRLLPAKLSFYVPCLVGILDQASVQTHLVGILSLSVYVCVCVHVQPQVFYVLRQGLLLLTGNVSGSKGGPPLLSALLEVKSSSAKFSSFFTSYFFFSLPTITIKTSLETEDHWRPTVRIIKVPSVSLPRTTAHALLRPPRFFLMLLLASD